MFDIGKIYVQTLDNKSNDIYEKVQKIKIFKVNICTTINSVFDMLGNRVQIIFESVSDMIKSDLDDFYLALKTIKTLVVQRIYKEYACYFIGKMAKLFCICSTLKTSPEAEYCLTNAV